MSEDRDTIVVKDGGSSTGLLLGIIAIIIVLAGAWYFLIGPGAGWHDRAERHQRQCGAPERRARGLLTRTVPKPSCPTGRGDASPTSVTIGPPRRNR